MTARWYISAVNDDPHTNEIITRIIGEQNAAESTRDDVLCGDGKRRNLWACRSYQREVKKAIVASMQKGSNLKLEILCEMGDGVIRPFVLWEPKIKKRAKLAQKTRVCPAHLRRS